MHLIWDYTVENFMAFGYNDMIVPADNIEVLLYSKRFAL